MELSDFEYYFVDIDRTLVQWKEPVIGASDFVHALRDAGKKLVYHSDNTLFTREEMAKKLRSMDMPAEKSKIMTSGFVAARELEKQRVESVFVIGEKSLHQEVAARGIKTSSSSENVLVGIDRQFNYSKLRKAAEIAEEGGLYVCSDEKMLGSDEFKPNQLAINRALETFSDSTLLGKPSDAFADKMRKLAYEPGKTIVIGDRIADVRLGKKLGVKTALVTSGEASIDDVRELPDEEKPDYVVSSLPKLTKRIV